MAPGTASYVDHHIGRFNVGSDPEEKSTGVPAWIPAQALHDGARPSFSHPMRLPLGLRSFDLGAITRREIG